MKKILLFAMFVGIAFASQAQVSFGLKGGVNLSNVGGKDAEGAKSNSVPVNTVKPVSGAGLENSSLSVAPALL